MEIVPEKTKNNVRKGRNAAFQYFLLFPQSFQTAFSSGESKVFIVWLRVYSLRNNKFLTGPNDRILDGMLMDFVNSKKAKTGALATADSTTT